MEAPGSGPIPADRQGRRCLCLAPHAAARPSPPASLASSLRADESTAPHRGLADLALPSPPPAPGASSAPAGCTLGPPAGPPPPRSLRRRRSQSPPSTLSWRSSASPASRHAPRDHGALRRWPSLLPSPPPLPLRSPVRRCRPAGRRPRRPLSCRPQPCRPRWPPPLAPSQLPHRSPVRRRSAARRRLVGLRAPQQRQRRTRRCALTYLAALPDCNRYAQDGKPVLP